MKINTLVANSLVAALYIAVSLLIQPIAFSSLQFRVSEIFNHLVVFEKKYFFGIVAGVFITNLFSPLGVYDLVFGVCHSIISLSLTILVSRFFRKTWMKMAAGTVIFTFDMFIIAFELHLAFELPFLITWLTTAAGEFAVMAIGIPVMLTLNRQLHFKRLMSAS